MEARPARTIVVAANPLLKEGIAAILRAADFLNIVTTTLNELEASLKSSSDRSLLVIDAGEDVAATLQRVGRIRCSVPSAWIAVVGERMQRHDVETAFRLGVNACFVKVLSCESFIKSLELVILGEFIVQPLILALDLCASQVAETADITHEMAAGRTVAPSAAYEASEESAMSCSTDTAETSEPGISALSARQQTILQCLIEGDSNKLIARKFLISEGTVKAHMKVLLRKIHVRNRTQAAIWGLNQVPRTLVAHADETNDGIGSSDTGGSQASVRHLEAATH